MADLKSSGDQILKIKVAVTGNNDVKALARDVEVLDKKISALGGNVPILPAGPQYSRYPILSGAAPLQRDQLYPGSEVPRRYRSREVLRPGWMAIERESPSTGIPTFRSRDVLGMGLMDDPYVQEWRRGFIGDIEGVTRIPLDEQLKIRDARMRSVMTLFDPNATKDARDKAIRSKLGKKFAPLPGEVFTDADMDYINKLYDRAIGWGGGGGGRGRRRTAASGAGGGGGKTPVTPLPVDEGIKAPDVVGRVILWSTASAAIFGFVGAISQAISNTIMLENEMIQIKKVMDQSLNFENVERSLYDLGTKYGEPINNVARIFRLWAQQNYDVADSLALTETTMRTMAAMELDLKSTTDLLTAVMRVWDIDIQSIGKHLAGLMGVQADFAVDAKDLAEVFTRIGPGVRAAGDDLSFLSGVATALIETTRKAPGAAATAIKSIYARIYEPGVAKTLSSIGITVKRDQNTFRDFRSIMSDLALKWGALSDVQRKNVAITIGHIRYWTDFTSIIENFNIAQRAQATYLRSVNEAQSATEMQVESLKNRFQGLSTEITKLGTNWGKETLMPSANVTIGGLRLIVSALDKVPKAGATAALAIGALGFVFRKFTEQMKGLDVARSVGFSKELFDQKAASRVASDISASAAAAATASSRVGDLGKKMAAFTRHTSVGIARLLGLNVALATAGRTLGKIAILARAAVAPFLRFIALAAALEAVFWVIGKVSDGFSKATDEGAKFSDEMISRLKEIRAVSKDGSLVDFSTSYDDLRLLSKAIADVTEDNAGQAITWTAVSNIINSLPDEVRTRLLSTYKELNTSVKSQEKLWGNIQTLVAYFDEVTLQRHQATYDSLRTKVEEFGKNAARSISVVITRMKALGVVSQEELIKLSQKTAEMSRLARDNSRNQDLAKAPRLNNVGLEMTERNLSDIMVSLRELGAMDISIDDIIAFNKDNVSGGVNLGRKIVESAAKEMKVSFPDATRDALLIPELKDTFGDLAKFVDAGIREGLSKFDPKTRDDIINRLRNVVKPLTDRSFGEQFGISLFSLEISEVDKQLVDLASTVNALKTKSSLPGNILGTDSLKGEVDAMKSFLNWYYDKSASISKNIEQVTAKRDELVQLYTKSVTKPVAGGDLTSIGLFATQYLGTIKTMKEITEAGGLTEGADQETKALIEAIVKLNMELGKSKWELEEIQKHFSEVREISNKLATDTEKLFARQMKELSDEITMNQLRSGDSITIELARDFNNFRTESVRTYSETTKEIYEAQKRSVADLVALRKSQFIQERAIARDNLSLDERAKIFEAERKFQEEMLKLGEDRTKSDAQKINDEALYTRARDKAIELARNETSERLKHFDIMTDLMWQQERENALLQAKLEHIRSIEERADSLRSIVKDSILDFDKVSKSGGASIIKDTAVGFAKQIYSAQAEAFVRSIISRDLAKTLLPSKDDEKFLEQISVMDSTLSKISGYIVDGFTTVDSMGLMPRGGEGQRTPNIVDTPMGTMGFPGLRDVENRGFVRDIEGAVTDGFSSSKRTQLSYMMTGANLINSALIGGLLRKSGRETNKVQELSGYATTIAALVTKSHPLLTALSTVGGGLLGAIFGKKNENEERMVASLERIEQHSAKIADMSESFYNIPGKVFVPPSGGFTMESGAIQINVTGGGEVDYNAVASNVINRLQTWYNDVSTRSFAR